MDSLLVSAGVVAIAEIGDKTQVATMALGTLIANVPAVLVGEARRPACRWAFSKPPTFWQGG